MNNDDDKTPSVLQFVDIGANLLDDRYIRGEYHGKQRHEPDFEQVLERASTNGVTHLILTAGTLNESQRAVQVVRDWREKQQRQQQQESLPLFLGCTVGVHPTRCQQEFVDNDGADPDRVLEELLQIVQDGVTDGCVVAIGEIGLDYDRLEFSPKDVQREFLKRQLETFLGAASPQVASLPLFLHNRSVGGDLLNVLQNFMNSHNNATKLRGVVHSFDDTLELAQEFIGMGFYIGLNGCSLKTPENLEVVRELPLSSILLETDCPYCEIKATHAGFPFIKTTFEKKAEKKFIMGQLVKGRNEPCQIVQVAEVIAGAKGGIPVQQVAKACYKNSMELYGFSPNQCPNH